MDGHAEMFARNVPQGDVYCAQRAHDRGTAEMAPAIQVLPVVLDAQRILTDQVALECLDGRRRGFEEGPCAGLTHPRDAGVGRHLDEEVAVDKTITDGGDLHGRSVSSSDRGYRLAQPATRTVADSPRSAWQSRSMPTFSV